MPDPSLAPELRFAVARLARRLRGSAADGLTPSLVSALATIDRRGPLTAGELARAEQISPPSVTSLLARLDEHGLIERVVDPSDKRVVHVGLNAEGRRRIAEIRHRKDRQLEELLATLSEEELAVLTAAAPILERISRCDPAEVPS